MTKFDLDLKRKFMELMESNKHTIVFAVYVDFIDK